MRFVSPREGSYQAIAPLPVLWINTIQSASNTPAIAQPASPLSGKCCPRCLDLRNEDFDQAKHRNNSLPVFFEHRFFCDVKRESCPHTMLWEYYAVLAIAWSSTLSC